GGHKGIEPAVAAAVEMVVAVGGECSERRLAPRPEGADRAGFGSGAEAFRKRDLAPYANLQRPLSLRASSDASRSGKDVSIRRLSEDGRREDRGQDGAVQDSQKLCSPFRIAKESARLAQLHSGRWPAGPR